MVNFLLTFPLMVGIISELPAARRKAGSIFGDMAEQVDAGDLKSPDFGRVGSIPSIPTTT